MIIKELEVIFRSLHKKEITPSDAIEKFLFRNGGGYVYLPAYVKTKKYKIIKLLAQGLNNKAIQRKCRVSKRYVQKLRKEHREQK